MHSEKIICYDHNVKGEAGDWSSALRLSWMINNVDTLEVERMWTWLMIKNYFGDIQGKEKGSIHCFCEPGEDI